jgi:hypothetical protein
VFEKEGFEENIWTSVRVGNKEARETRIMREIL